MFCSYNSSISDMEERGEHEVKYKSSHAPGCPRSPRFLEPLQTPGSLGKSPL